MSNIDTSHFIKKPIVAIIGLGEVGSSIYEIAVESEAFEVYGYDMDSSRGVDRLKDISRPVDYLHITIPYKEEFVENVKFYIEELRPEAMIIHSSIAPGTTRIIYKNISIPIAYSPVRGKHPNLKKHLLFWNKWITAMPLEKLGFLAKHLSDMGFKVKEYHGSPETLELAKLWETVYRAVMIAAWQELHRMALKYDADVTKIAEFIEEVHEVLRDRPIYFPSHIGGHCLIPNTIILNNMYQSKLLDSILESNDKRVEELKDEKIMEDIRKLKELAMKLTNNNYYK